MFSKERIQKEKEQKKSCPKEVTARVPGYQLRIQQELENLDKEWLDHLVIADTNKLDKMTITIVPSEGIWKNHPHEFELIIPHEYPHKAPNIICKTRIWHPNIDENGLVDLNLRYLFKPTMGLKDFFVGVLFLMLEPNPLDPQNYKAGRQFLDEPEGFKQKANNYMKGIYQ
ncbi:predicted protein [Naegleria gruberi]|uniref:Predicted protein n=1 Tax=Naegleria gruberi TaxID=5762 RepID=D2W3W1_NAEGR|nr:uncharacterized protein NAEGRDRAFT_76085 [Naegleria gruberi]EFC36239.1 predicted protein [Naegleria gruberi]|eukprot:XP_002668983.1 predicted protein [Naegleria gruberi strain NEG-M]